VRFLRVAATISRRRGDDNARAARRAVDQGGGAPYDGAPATGPASGGNGM